MNPAIELSKTLRNSPFYYRPLCLTSAVFVLSLSACVLFGWIAMLFTAIPVLIYAVFWFRRLGSYRLILPWIMLAVLALTAAVFGVYSFQRGKTLEIALSDEAQTSESETPNSKKSVMAEVVSEYYSEVFGSSHYVKLLEIDGEKVYGHAVLESEDPLNAQAYDIIRADCTFSEYTNIGAGSSATYPISMDIMFLMNAETASVKRECKSGFLYYILVLREKIAFEIRKLLTPSEASFAMAVLFGIRDGMSETLSRDFSSTGITHLLAVSGSHFSVLVGAVNFMLARISVSKRKRMFPILVFAVVFSALSGFSNAVMRAAIMLILSLVIKYIGYRPDPLISLFASVAIICFFQPYAAFDVGLQLSFFATLGLLLQLNRASSERRDRPKLLAFAILILESLKMTLAATLFTFPVIAICYGEISFMTLPVNVIAGPLISVAMLVVVAIIAVCKIPVISTAVAWLFSALYKLLSTGIGLIAVNSETSMSLRAPHVVYVMLFCACLFVLLRLLAVRKRIMAFLPLALSLILLVCINVLLGVTATNQHTLGVITHGQNEFIVAKSGNQILLCDLSDGSKTPAQEAVVEMYNAFGNTDIDVYMLTHYHTNHVSSVSKIMRNRYVRTVLLPLPENDTERSLARSINGFAQKYGSKVEYYTRGESFEFAGITVLAQTEEHFKSSHPSFLLRFTTSEDSFTYFGSALHETDGLIYEMSYAATGGTLFFGAHGPMVKETDEVAWNIGSECVVYISPGSTASVPSNSQKLTAEEDGIGRFYFKLK